MKYKGQLFWTPGIAQDASVKDAVITTKRISIDWEDEDGDQEHLEASSRDGCHYRGMYGPLAEEARYEFDLTLFKTRKEVLLFGTWCEEGNEGIWTFRLSKCQVKKATSTAKPAATKENRPAEKSKGSHPKPRRLAPVSRVRQQVLGKKPSAERSIITSPPRAALVTQGNAQRLTKGNEASIVVQVPKELLSMTRGNKYQDGTKWVLTTKHGARVATFDTEAELEKWWSDFQHRQGRSPRKLTTLDQRRRTRSPGERPLRSAKARRAKAALAKAKLEAERPRNKKMAWRSREHRKVSYVALPYRGKPTAEYLQPPSEKYDMPEYDLN